MKLELLPDSGICLSSRVEQTYPTTGICESMAVEATLHSCQADLFRGQVLADSKTPCALPGEELYGEDDDAHFIHHLKLEKQTESLLSNLNTDSGGVPPSDSGKLTTNARIQKLPLVPTGAKQKHLQS